MNELDRLLLSYTMNVDNLTRAIELKGNRINKRNIIKRLESLKVEIANYLELDQ